MLVEKKKEPSRPPQESTAIQPIKLFLTPHLFYVINPALNVRKVKSIQYRHRNIYHTLKRERERKKYKINKIYDGN